MKHTITITLTRITLLLATAVLFSTCRIINPAEDIPSFLVIDHINLTASPGQGSTANKIVDAWVYVDGTLIGGFELPARIPILDEGTHVVQVQAGVLMNGASTTHVAYPFYRGVETNVTLERGKDVVLNPTVSYFPAITPVWLEDFDQIGNSVDNSAGSGAPWPNIQQITSQGGMEANALHIVLNNDTLEYRARSSTPYSLPVDGSQVYLELNYKSNHAFSVGLITSPNATFVQWGIVNASENWNKIYINLTESVTAIPSSGYYIYFDMIRSQSDPSAELYLDNIKLLKL